MTRDERARLRARCQQPEPPLFGPEPVLALLDENDRLRSQLTRAWAAYLEGLLDARLEDGTPMLEAVLWMDDSLRKRVRDVIMRRGET